MKLELIDAGVDLRGIAALPTWADRARTGAVPTLNLTQKRNIIFVGSSTINGFQFRTDESAGARVTLALRKGSPGALGFGVGV